MAKLDEIRAACASAVRNKIPIDIDIGDGAEPLQPAEPEYVKACERALSNAEKFQRALGGTPRLWTAAMIDRMGDFKRRYGVPIKFRLLDGHGQLLTFQFSNSGAWIDIGILADAPPSAEVVPFSLDHEYGHIRDRRFLETSVPALVPIFAHAPQYSQSDLLDITRAIVTLLRARIAGSDQPSFDEQVRFVLGVLPLPKQYQLLIEVLRYGEEVHDARVVERDRLWPSNLFEAGAHIMVEASLRAVTRARALEAGTWHFIEQSPAFDPRSVTSLKTTQVDFFRRCIRAAAEYFPTIRPSPPATEP
ncbi:MAG: hypothetical protein HY543_06225 [Deltaproteobacteria bacterium]|nr:hypothetical protein [Deltaproteobacteria bacterium]